MEQVYQEIVSRKTEPTRQDIADLLAAIAPRGQQLEQKRSTVQQLFNDIGGGRNANGHHVVDTLEDWGAF